MALRSHGWTRDLSKNFYLKKDQKKYENYCFTLPGYNVRPTNLNAAIGIEQLKKLNNLIKIRRKNHKIFSKIFENDKRFIFQKFNKEHSCFAFTLIFRPQFRYLKNKVFKALKKNKIEFRLITGGSFFKHPVKKYFKYSKFNGSKNVDYVHENGFFIGNHPKNLKKELTFFKNTLKEL